MPTLLRSLAFITLFSRLAFAQTIASVAGTDWFFPTVSVPALSAPLGAINAIALDSAGNFLVADSGNHIVVRVTPAGVLSIVAGNAVAGFSGDLGPAASASLNTPTGVAVDYLGNIYIADYGNHRVRKVSPGGIISTVAGNGSQNSYGDGRLATQAGVTPYGLAVDGNGGLFISDTNASRVRKLTPDGMIGSVAGTGAPNYYGDGGPASSAGLFPLGLAVSGSGSLYIADYFNHRIRRVTPDGTITTVAGNGTAAFAGDGGSAGNASLNYPEGVSVGPTGNLYITDTENHRIRVVMPNGVIQTIAGAGSADFYGDGSAAVNAALYPSAAVVDAAGEVLIADYGNRRVRVVSPGGVITTIAGNGGYRFTGDNGLASSAALSTPTGVAVDAVGSVYIADAGNQRIRKVTADGNIATVAGDGAVGYSGDSVLSTAVGSNPVAVAVDASGNFYFADQYNNRVRKVAANGVITTLAGSGVAGYTGDKGPATSATLDSPAGVVVDAAGNVYIADQNNNAVRRVDPKGVITTVAGTGTARFSGDNGPATLATLYQPSGVAVDGLGYLYIADQYNGRIRRVTPSGVISTIAGRGTAGYSGDGAAAIYGELNFPSSIAVDASGNVYIADTGNNRVRVLTPDGMLNTVAGNGTASLSGDSGLATGAGLDNPTGVAVDASGNLYIADSGNNRIRVVTISVTSGN